MIGMLEAGQRLRTDDGEHVTVERLLGSGGEGEVYRAHTPSGAWALKWYLPQIDVGYRREILETLVHRAWGDDRFLWPRTIVTDPEAPSGEGLGYLMPLRPDRYRDLRALLRRDPSVNATPRSLVTVGLHAAEAYLALHSRGIAYRDISWGNIFFDPVAGDVLVCDNDNAVVEGEAAGVAGTMTFMAPELVRADRGAEPCIQTDLHSLAVLLFLLLMNHHPLEGAEELKIHCMGPQAQRKLYGTDPVFIYDPGDRRNWPVPGEQDTVIATWGALPPVLRRLFVRTFTDGLADPKRRVRESEWRDALSAVRDAIVVCGACGKQNLAEPGGGPPVCWKDGHPVALPMRLELATGTGGRRGRRDVRMHKGAELYAHHLLPDPDRHDFTAVVGRVTEHPSRPGRLGLTNEGRSAWTMRRPDGTGRQIEPGKTAALRPGVMLEFGGGAEAWVRDR
jgi:DNA-binding helix-hairpin-helix protein with protein kinase domain